MSNLIEIVDKKISQVRTISLDISFNELLDMYENEELIISPDYQRLFRWSEEKQSRFIESLILELPLPPVFVIETTEGQYELIDGLQRISSYLHFRGQDKDELKLKDCDIIPELNGLKYNDLPKVLQIKLKRNSIKVEVLRGKINNNLKYFMFKRLKSGGEALSEQEIRNCTVRFLNPKINEFIINMSEDENFKNTTLKLKNEDIEKKRNEELVLIFFALKNNLNNYSYPFDEYLTKYMEEVAKGEVSFDFIREEKNFKDTFMILNKILGENIFSTKLSSGKYQNNFILYYFDGFILGIQKYLEEIIYYNNYEDLITIFEDIKSNEKFYNSRTGNKNNIKTRVSIIEKKLQEFFNDN